VLLEVGELTPGNETQEARALWDAVESESRRMHAPFDSAWFARVLEEPGAPPAGLEAERTRVSPTLEVNATERYAVERREDLGEAPDVVNFVGRADELGVVKLSGDER